MKKPYTLDYSIQRDVDRLKAVEEILDSLDKKPSPTELEQMGSYILYGKDENGLNAYQRGEMLRDARYNSYKTKDDEVVSLDEILENPLSDQQQFREMGSRDPYIQPKTTIKRPKYDKKTGEMIDPGDSDIPGMTDLWESIDRIEHWIAAVEGRVDPYEDEEIFNNPYRLYKLKHALIDLRRHQYYLKDAYKPTIHFLAADHPKRQYMNWSSDSCYWISRADWEQRVNSTFFPVSKNIEDYETRNEGNEVKWVVRRHTFDWEDPNHVYALICNYLNLKNLLWDKLDTDGHALLMDFDRYRKMANLTDVREYILDCKINQYTQSEICHKLQVKYGLKYGESRLYAIINREIPDKIIEAVRKHRLLTTTPAEQCKKCTTCGRLLPRDNLFFVTNRSRKDNFASRCKECERALRIARGTQGQNDRRKKETHLPEVQTGTTGN